MNDAGPSVRATEFRAKRWIHFAQAIVLGPFATFGLGFGPLCLLGYHRRVDGSSAADAGWPLIVVGAACLLLFVQAVFNILARRRPLLRLCREGVEFAEVGRSSLDSVPFVPRLIRIAWPILSGQGFRSRVIRIPWGSFRGAWVSGPPMARLLTIDVRSGLASPRSPGQPVLGTGPLILREVLFTERLDRIAEAIGAAAASPDSLKSWDDR